MNTVLIKQRNVFYFTKYFFFFIIIQLPGKSFSDIYYRHIQQHWCTLIKTDTRKNNTILIISYNIKRMKRLCLCRNIFSRANKNVPKFNKCR